MTEVSGRAPARLTSVRLTLYSRSYCHLCEDMLAALNACLARAGLTCAVDVIDVDADPALVARYDERVPVLVAKADAGNDDRELCHYFLDEAAVLHYVRYNPGQGQSR